MMVRVCEMTFLLASSLAVLPAFAGPALDVLVEEGYAYDASIFPIHHDRYGIPDAERHPHVLHRRAGTLVELPGSTLRVGGVNWPIAGGGYFRVFPYAWTSSGISRVNRVERKPVVFYLHPWEIDPGQPRLAVGAARRFRHYTGLEKTTDRLRRLLREFRFTTAVDVLDLRAAQTAERTA